MRPGKLCNRWATFSNFIPTKCTYMVDVPQDDKANKCNYKGGVRNKLAVDST